VRLGDGEPVPGIELHRTVDAGIAPADGKVPSLEEALRILSEKVVRGR